MTTGDLRRRLEAFARGEGLEFISPASLINEVDETSFNYSVEEPILRRYGDYFRFPAPWSFSTIQPCVRPADLGRLQRGKNTWRLSLFEMGVVDYELSPVREDARSLHQRAIERFWQFCVETVGLDPDQLRVSYFAGGRIPHLDNSASDAEAALSADSVTPETFRMLGLADEHLCAQADLDTFLLTFPIPSDFWAGYRFEVFAVAEHSSELVEIGTGEALTWRCVKKGDRLRALEPGPGCVVAFAVGIERLLAVQSGLRSVYDTDVIAPLHRRLCEMTSEGDTVNTRALTDALRACHMIVADGGTFETLNRRRRKHFRAYLRTVDTLSRKSHLPVDALKSCWEMNAALQPWHHRLAGSIDAVAGQLIGYRGRKKAQSVE
jgi:hypothetical protein